MQRYHGASCASAVNNNSIGGASVRDTTRADSSSLPTNFSINSRRSSLLTPYKLKCDKESLNSRLGPPDFHPQTPTCPEENLTREYVQSGYKETLEGLEEAREISVTQVPAFTKPLVVKCKDAIRKRLRAINESRAQKRKAGQVYGVPLSGSLLTKPGVFPEQRPCGEDFRKKWIEGLSQQHKRLRSLADNVPHGYRRKTLFEVLIRNNVPLLRATWFIKVTYLNQVRTASASISSGAPDKTQYLRSELWTKDVIDYLQILMDDFFARNNTLSNTHNRDRSPQMFYTGSFQQKGDPSSAVLDGEEPSLYFKWWYMVRLLHWHQAEGILLPSLIIDWVLAQLQDKDLFEILQLLLPIIYGVLETVVLSQTYVRSLVGIAIRFIRESSPGGSDPVHNSRRAYTTSGLVEMVRYLILAVPDIFVALNCFPLPQCVISYSVNDGNFVLKAREDTTEFKYSLVEVSRLSSSKDVDVQYQSLALNNVVSSIQKCTDNLSKTANPEFSNHSVAKAIQALDKSLSQGDIHRAYKYFFKDFCDGDVNEGWIGEVSPCLRSSLRWFRTVSTSFVCSVFSLCEWATCDFRNFQTAVPSEVKFTGGMDFSQVYIAVWLLKLKLGELQVFAQHKNESHIGTNTIVKAFSLHNNLLGRPLDGSLHEPKNSAKTVDGRSMNFSKMFDSPGPLHDILVCWIDQHDVQKGEGLKRLQLLIAELISAGIFYPHSYVRQLMVSGIMDINGPAFDSNKWKRHHRILKQLPTRFIHNALEETKIAQGPKLLEIMKIYSNERHFMLHDFISDRADFHNTNVKPTQYGPHNQISGKDGISAVSVNQMKAHLSSYLDSSSKKIKHDAIVEELKEAISVLLHLPNIHSAFADAGMCESSGSGKRSFVSVHSKMDVADGTTSCEECRRAKKQKTIDDKSSFANDHSSSLSDDEDMWWTRREPKSSESVKVDPPLKSTKQVSKSRQKVVRKTQSLAQLAATRIEGSQGASTSHVCDNKVTCPHHKTGIEETSKPDDGIRTNCGADILLVGKDLKRLHFVEKRALTSWLVMVIKQLLEETEKTIAKPGQYGRPFTSVDDRSSTRWKLREDELSVVLYLMDICNDLVSAVKFILWLLPKVHRSPNSSINSRRNAMLVPRTVENQVCEVGEAYLLSSLRRYENVLVSTDLIPEALSVIINRATSIMASNGRLSGSAALHYAKYLLKKYSNVISVIEWEKNFKATCDKRLVSELDSGSSMDGESGFPLGATAGVDDLDDFFRQKIGGNRLSRVGMGMRDLVQRQFDDAFHFLFGKERKVFSGGSLKGPSVDKSDDGYQIAQGIITGLMDCIRQTGGAAQEGDPSLVSSAVSAVIGNVGIAVSKIPDFLAGSGSGFSSSTSSLSITRRILQIHITCLCLLKEALGERQSRVFEIALAAEASSALAGVFPSGKASRSQLQSVADSHDSTSSISSENVKSVGKATKIAVAVSALVVGALIHGITSLERLVTVFRLKEGLDFIHFVRNSMLNSNGNARSVGGFKIENSVEVYLHWFRLLVGNCRSIFDGMIVELLGEPSVVALSRMQRMLPLTLVFPPAYSIFAFVMWRPFVLNATLAAREDINQLYQSLMIAIGDVIRHIPFRDVCLRDCQSFYDLVVADTSDGEFAAILDLNGSELHTKSMAFVPLRARLFLNSIIDCKLPSFVYAHEDGNRGLGDYKNQFGENKTKLLDRLIHVLDTIQPAKFHWQWVELRLLLNEQALIEKLETHDMPLANAIRLSSPSLEKAAASDNENNFIEIILTRLLVRPDAAPLYSDVIHLFGQSLGDSMLLHAKWFLGGVNVLFGRSSIRQRLINIAENKGFLVKPQVWKPWGWCNSVSDPSTSKGEKKKFEVSYIEEGEVIDEGLELRRCGKGSAHTCDSEGGSNGSLQHETERALIDLILPCIDQSSDDSRNTFASDLIKQLNSIEQQINAISRGVSKQTGTAPSGIEGPTNKGNSRKAMKGGSPGLSRRSTSSPDLAPLSPAALRASMALRLQLLLRLLPVIRADREPSGRNMRHMLASVILRLLGNRVVHEDSVLTLSANNSSIAKKELAESPSKVSPTTAFFDISGESLFDRLLLVLHALLSSCEPSWLRSKSAIKSTGESTKEFTALDRELVESLQSDLDLMQLPDTLRLQIQAAMPILLPSVRCFISCHPPTFPFLAVASLHPSTMLPMSGSANQGNKLPSPRTVAHVPGKSKSMTLQDTYTEIDPWTVLEDGVGSNSSSSSTSVIGGGDHTNLRASNLLKGAVRIRRTELAYIGAVDDYS